MEYRSHSRSTEHASAPTRDVLSFGGGFVDYDDDGWLDLFIANGHVYPEIEQASPETHYKQRNSLFHNERNGKFKDTSAAGGLSALSPRAGRGVAFADFDNDGYVDVVVANNGDPPTLLRNTGSHENHFVNFKLVGTKSNRDALGARIRITSGKISQIREIAGGGELSFTERPAGQFWFGERDRGIGCRGDLAKRGPARLSRRQGRPFLLG